MINKIQGKEGHPYLALALIKEQEALSCGNGALVHEIGVLGSYIDFCLRDENINDPAWIEFCRILVEQMDVILKYARMVKANQGFDRTAFNEEWKSCRLQRNEMLGRLTKKGS